MSMVIWKYRLQRPGHSFKLEIPEGYQIVHAGLDGGTFTAGISDGKPMPAIWVNADPSLEKISEEFCLIATGEEYRDDQWEYIATLNVAGYFFHLLRRYAS